MPSEGARHTPAYRGVAGAPWGTGKSTQAREAVSVERWGGCACSGLRGVEAVGRVAGRRQRLRAEQRLDLLGGSRLRRRFSL